MFTSDCCVAADDLIWHGETFHGRRALFATTPYVEKIGLPVGAGFRYDGSRWRSAGSLCVAGPHLSLNLAPENHAVSRELRIHFSIRRLYQAVFEAETDTDDPLSAYLLIQRQFEIPDGGTCYVETHDEKYIGHFRLRRVRFTPSSLSIEFDRPDKNFISVTLSIAVSDFEGALQVVRIISGEIEPE
jgi:hypothetical protein